MGKLVCLRSAKSERVMASEGEQERRTVKLWLNGPRTRVEMLVGQATEGTWWAGRRK